VRKAWSIIALAAILMGTGITIGGEKGVMIFVMGFILGCFSFCALAMTTHDENEEEELHLYHGD
jgi:hypothetical protein